MAKILIVAATQKEAGFLLKQCRKSANKFIMTLKGSTKHEIDVLVTGPGMVATAYFVSKAVGLKKYDLAINIGICGSIDKKLKPVRLVNIVTEQFGDFGAFDGTKIIDIFELGLIGSNELPYKKGKLVSNFTTKLNCLKAISKVGGITVNMVNGNEKEIKKIHKKFGDVVESMEGAAFYYVCLSEKIKCLQIRAISNIVEKRNRKNWKIEEAINSLEGFIGLLLMELENSIE